MPPPRHLLTPVALACLLGAWTARGAPHSLYDDSFGIGGGANGPVNAIVIQSTGRIVVAGDFTTLKGQAAPRLARLHPDGSFDPEFQPGAGADAEVTALLCLPDDRLILAGTFASVDGQPLNGLAQLEPDGAVDPGFQIGTGSDGGTAPERGVYALVRLADGRLLVGGGFESWNGEPRGGLARLSATGELDPDYASSTSFQQTVMSLLPLPDGRLLVGGWFPQVNFQPEAGLAVLETDGSWSGMTRFGLSLNSGVTALAALGDGRILVGGTLYRDPVHAVGLLRLTAALTPDPTFEPPTFEAGFVSALHVDAEGRVLVGGSFNQVNQWWRRFLVRLTAADTVDPCFETGLGLGSLGADSPVRAITRQSDGRILVGGAFYGFDGVHCEHLVRLRDSGECAVPRLALIRSELTGHHELYATAPPGQPHVLEFSSDLNAWSDLGAPFESFQRHDLDPALMSPELFFRFRPGGAAGLTPAVRGWNTPGP